MNRITPQALYALLPAVHRLRDADEGGPLRALMAVLAREGAVVEENVEQLLDNLFIETCADWAAPYIGGTIGYRALYPVEGTDVGNRAEVANTIAYRRRKGTAAVSGGIGPRRHRLARPCGGIFPDHGHMSAHEPHPARSPSGSRSARPA